MDEWKIWYRSRTVWGALIAILASLLQFFGLEIDAAARGDLVEAAITLAGAAGGLLALYGRLSASGAIRIR